MLFNAKQIKKYMLLAREISDRNVSCTEWKIGAIIVGENGAILGRGYNRYSGKIKIIERNFNISGLWTLHAEADAIIDAIENKEETFGATIFIDGTKRNENEMLTYPCADCMRLIRAVGIKNIYYRNRSGKIRKHIGEITPDFTPQKGDNNGA